MAEMSFALREVDATCNTPTCARFGVTVRCRAMVNVGGTVRVVCAVCNTDSATVPTGAADEVQAAEPLPERVRTHLQHLRDYAAADPSAITNSQTVHVVQDLIKAVWLLNKRLENEG
jgi:hypothetical protein